MTLKNIYTYGGKPAQRNLTVADFIHDRGIRKFTSTVPGTQEEAEACAAAEIDHLSVWNTLTSVIRTGAPNTFINAALPMSQYVTRDEILRAAMRAAEAGADSVQTPRSLEIVEMLAKEGLSVQGHLGLIPRCSTQVGGLRIIGKTAQEALDLLQQFRQLEEAGAFAVEVECVASNALAEIRKHSNLVMHSIGAGSAGDVILLYLEDICGDVENPPRHARAFGDLRTIRKQLASKRIHALSAFQQAVVNGEFPGTAESVSMPENEYAELLETLDKLKPVHR
ncbi:3-methyl-2-oxobutanoate hydroxymethyltransferase [Gammaproteobacteria bacterium]|nr:3-methyl-2-oxobutanoate hydroxymethyltransferase [Gammaproteobacteria bacterium]